MSDNMTPSEEGNALSVNSGADALAALRQKETPETTEAEEQAEVESEEVEAEASEEVETDGEADETEESSEEADDESEPEEQESIEITLPSGDKITAEEAAKGYLRESDYTRKMQQGKSELQKLEAQTTEQLKTLDSLYQELSNLRPREPDWDKVAEEFGETEALKYQRNWDKQQKTYDAARRQIEQQKQHSLAQQQMQARDMLQSGQLIPEWASPENLGKGLEGVSKYLSGYGYPEELLAQIADPVAISIAEKARRYDELQSVKPEAKKAVKAKPKPLKPGSKTHVRTAQEQDKAKVINRFRQTKTLEDGMAAIQMLRKSAER